MGKPRCRAIPEAAVYGRNSSATRTSRNGKKMRPRACGEQRRAECFRHRNHLQRRACPVFADSAQPAGSDPMRRREELQLANLKTQDLLDLPARRAHETILQMSPEDRRALATTAKGARADALMEGMSPQTERTR